MDYDYNREQLNDFILNSLVMNRAILNVLMAERARDLAARPGGKPWSQELEALERIVEKERQIALTEYMGQGPESPRYTLTRFTERPEQK